MRLPILGVLALVATAWVSASVLPPPNENVNNALLAAPRGEANELSWCYCAPDSGVEDVIETFYCCMAKFDQDLEVSGFPQ